MTIDNTKVINELISWLQSVIEAAKNDEDFLRSYFEKTRHEKFNIVAGWVDGFDNYDDLLYVSKSNPRRALCVEIIVNTEINEEPYDYLDCIAIEQEDDLKSLAEFLYGEWEHITDKHKK